MAELFDDFDNDVTKKEELVKEAAKLGEQEDVAAALSKANSLRKSWKRLHDNGSLREEELRDEFEKFMDVIYAKKDVALKAAASTRTELVEKAKQLLDTKNFAEGTKKMNELMDSWKKAPSAGKDKDDELWGLFNESRQKFFENRKSYYENMNANFAKAKEAKEAIIAKAKELATSTEWKKTTQAMNDLMDQWKAAGNAGKENEDGLWQAFSEARSAFNSARNKHYEQLRADFEDKYQQKEALVAQAKALVEKKEFSKDVTEQVKALRAEWKKIGFCGKDKEDEIWKQFNETVNVYFDQLKSINDEKHENWVNKMKDNINYKKDMINRLNKDIAWLKKDSASALSESAIRENDAEIADKEAYIADLNKEIADIEAKIK